MSDEDEFRFPTRFRDDDDAPAALRSLGQEVPGFPSEVRARVRSALEKKTRSSRAALAWPLLAAAALALIVWRWPATDPPLDGPIAPLLPEPGDAGPADAGPGEPRARVPALEIAGTGCGLELLLALEPVEDDIASVALVLSEVESVEDAAERVTAADCTGRVVAEVDAALFGQQALVSLPFELRPPEIRCDAHYTVTVCVRDGAGRLSTQRGAIAWPVAASEREMARTTRTVATPSGPAWVGNITVGHVLRGRANVPPPPPRSWATPGPVSVPVPVDVRVLRRDPFADEDAVLLVLEDGGTAELYASTPVWTGTSTSTSFRAASELAPGDEVLGERGWRRVRTVSAPHAIDELPVFDVTWPDTLFMDDVLVRDLRTTPASDAPPTASFEEPVRAVPVRNWDCSLAVELAVDELPADARAIAVVVGPHHGRAGRRTPMDCDQAVGREIPLSLLAALPDHRLWVTVPAWDSEMGDWHPSDAPPSVPALACDHAYSVLACVRGEDGALRPLATEGRWARTGPACFAEGTLVSTPAGPLPIESLTRGARVTTLVDGRALDVPVTALIPRGERAILTLEFSSGTHLRVTREHPLFDARRGLFRVAGDFAVGDALLGEHGEDVEILARDDGETALVYDLSVGGPHTYLADGVLAHNY